jgi:hypothetical protein
MGPRSQVRPLQHLVGDRFSIEANGNADSVDVLKQAVASVNAGRLEGPGARGAAQPPLITRRARGAMRVSSS